MEKPISTGWYENISLFSTYMTFNAAAHHGTGVGILVDGQHGDPVWTMQMADLTQSHTPKTRSCAREETRKKIRAPPHRRSILARCALAMARMSNQNRRRPPALIASTLIGPKAAAATSYYTGPQQQQNRRRPRAIFF